MILFFYGSVQGGATLTLPTQFICLTRVDAQVWHDVRGGENRPSSPVSFPLAQSPQYSLPWYQFVFILVLMVLIVTGTS